MRFQDLVGQSQAIQTIQETIANDRLAHAMLLTGPAGVGQLAFANAIAQYANCLDPKDGDSCGTCSNCLKIAKVVHPDVNFILPIISKTSGGKRYLTGDFIEDFRELYREDPYASFGAWQRKLGGESKQLFISVHEIRELKRGIYLKAFEAPYKVLIVWRAELINQEGANAFLKLLEEPPDRTLLILTCSDPSRLLTTINSRVQRIQLSRIDPPEIAGYLTRQGTPGVQAREVAAIAEGSIGQAREFLSESNQQLTQLYMDWLRAIYLGDYQKIQDQSRKVFQESKEFQKLFVQLSIQKIRDAMLYHLKMPQLALATEEEKQFLEKFSPFVSPEKAEKMIQHLEDGYRHLSGNVHPPMIFTTLSLRLHGILRSA
ncbi:MAG: hypothetical protein AAF399_16005 [Bacteroidota bacterium]